MTTLEDDIRYDRGFLAGLNAGWNYGASNNHRALTSAVESVRREIREARLAQQAGKRYLRRQVEAASLTTPIVRFFRFFTFKRAASDIEYRCIVCDELQDETEFSDPADANLCGYCVNERMQGIMAEGREFAPGLNECGRQRELSIQAVCELEMEHAERFGNTVEAETLRRVIKLLNC